MKLPNSPLKETILLSIFIFTLSLGQLQRIPVAWGAQYAHELVLLVFLFITRQRYARVLIATWKKTSLNAKILVALIVFGVLLQNFTTGEQRGLLLTFRAFLYASTAWTVYVTVSNKQKQLLRLFLLASGLVMAAMGILQYLFLPDVRFLVALGWDDHYYRAIGSMLDPNYLGILLVLTLANLWSWTKKIPHNWLLSLTILLSITIGMTLSRATFLAAVVFLATQFLAKKQLTSLAAIAIILTVVLLPKPTGEGVNLLRTSSINSRVSHDQSIIMESLNNPIKMLFGTGLFSSTHQSTAPDKSFDHGLIANNVFVLLYQGIGLVGIALLLPMVWQGYRILYKKENLIAFGILALFVHAQFNNTFFEPIIFSYWVWTLATLQKARAET
ncbi:MAG: hypothetical protein O2840_01460 [bacterium]|nr:hypothetical protein [bacterium]